MSELALKVEVDPQGKKLFDDIAKRFPREMARAVARTGSIMKRQIVAALRNFGGKNGVPAWQDLHPLTYYTRKGPQGINDMVHLIALKKYGRGTIEIGWASKGGIQGMAADYHGGKTYAYAWQQQWYLAGLVARKMGGDTSREEKKVLRDHFVGSEFNMPARPLYEPYTRNLPPEKIRQWMLGNVRKMIEKTAAKSRG